ERQLLVHHGQDAAVGRVNGNDGAVHVAESVNRCLAHDRIFTRGDVAIGHIVGIGTGGEALVIVLSPPVIADMPGGFRGVADATNGADPASLTGPAAVANSPAVAQPAHLSRRTR